MSRHDKPTIDSADPEAHSAAAHTAALGATVPNPGAAIDYRRFLDCVHCGLCTSACPTYLETGDENDSPRGRIYLMRGVTDGRLQLAPEVRRHLELCLDCRACETACPSGVQYGRLIEPFRIAMETAGSGAGGQRTKTSDWFHRWLLYGLFPNTSRLRAALALARVAQRLKLDRAARGLGLFGILPARMRQLVEMLPPLPPALPALPEFLPAIGPRRARVALFTGCIGDAMFRDTNWAAARVLQQNGCDVLVPRGQVCCGAIHFHSGASEPALRLAEANLAAFNSSGDGGAASGLGAIDAIVTCVAGCGAMLKDYGHNWSGAGGDAAGNGARSALAGKVRDVCEFLDELGLLAPRGAVPLVATYHDACHLAHAQRVREAPRRLLSQIPGLELRELAESDLCCGAAGTYNLTEPEMATRLGQRKLKNVLATGAQTVVTGNAGCLLQITSTARRQGEQLTVVHPVELLDRSYGKQ